MVVRNTKIVIFMFLIIAIIIYSIVRISFTLSLAHEYTYVERTFSIMLLVAELFILLHALGYALNLVHSGRLENINRHLPTKTPEPPPAVAVLVAARHEPKHVLEGTFRSLSNLRYPNKTIYFLDDSSDGSFMREADELAKKYDLKLFRRKERHGAKAGIVNDCLKKMTEKYVAIFDADQNPMPGFLNTLVPILEADKKLAFIQTPQFYENIDTSRVARGAGYQQAVFYEYICEAKGSNQSMFCCGTNVVFDREALLSVGGFDETVVTEDFATSVKLHINGWRSLYYNHVGVFGMGPETLEAYFKQQSRWARGTIGVFRKIVWNFIKNPFALSVKQWWEYFLSGTYYFVGLAFIFLMICPIAYLLYDVPSFFIHDDIYLSVFVPYFSLSLVIFYTTLKVRFYNARDLFMAQVLIYITFPVLIMSTVAALIGAQGTFGITMKGRGRHMPYIQLWPQLTFMFLNFIALVWGLNRFVYEQELSLLINCFWAFYHFVIMSGIFYFNQDLSQEVTA